VWQSCQTAHQQNVGIIFKGSGFYVTDHRSEDYKQKATGDGKGASGAGALDAAGS